MNGKTISSMKCILCLFCLLALPAQGASFDCAKAGTKVEKLICADAELSKLDEELNAAYKTALQNEKQADAVKQAQKQWMKERNGCADAGCVKSAYQNRIGKLTGASNAAEDTARARAVPAMPTPRTQKHSGSSSQLKLLKGKGVEVCEIYKKNLDAMNVSDMRCEREVAPEYEQIIKKPEWTALDVWENRNLMALAGKFLDYGDTTRKDTVYDDQQNIDATAEGQGGRLKGITMMTAPIDIDNNGAEVKVLRFQSGICGLAIFSYATAILVLNKDGNAVDAPKSQLLYPDSWRNPDTGQKIPDRQYINFTYGIFSFAGNTYFDRMSVDGLLNVYKVSNGINEEVCKFKTIK